MNVLHEIEHQVNEIADKRGMKPDYAFGFWFLESVEDLSQEDAEETVTDGPWDGGRDAVHYDQEAAELIIYQMKWSESRSYVLQAFADLQKGLTAEYSEHPDRFEGLKTLRLRLVTKFNSDPEFEAIRLNQRKRIRTWLTKKGLVELSPETDVEVYDLRKFAQMLERLYGVDLSLTFREQPIHADGNYLGLVDARAFRPVIQHEELFAFNIRKFLGLSKKSVNYQIKETLDNEERRSNFWTYNNGIVCLFTEAKVAEGAPKTVAFKDLTIVNGAQTVSTVAAFLEENPLVGESEAVWVVCKAVGVSSTDLEQAARLTRSSNTQNPASNRDIRAGDQSHVRIAKWCGELGYTYVYKRGGRRPSGASIVPMKEMAQAYTAFELGEPNVAFARPGTLFGSNESYERVFPPDEIGHLFNVGSDEEQLGFARRRIIPVLLLEGIRASLGELVKSGEDKKWKSLAYHVLFVYGLLLHERTESAEILLKKVPAILQASLSGVVLGLMTLAGYGHHEIPRDLKSDSFQKAVGQDWLPGQSAKLARAAITSALASQEE